MLRLHLAVLVVFVGAGAGCGSGSQAVPQTAASSPKALQACAVRFNWMHLQRWFSNGMRARIKAAPCEVDILWSRSVPNVYYPCKVNGFGAYDCANDWIESSLPPAGLNATYHSATGAVILDHPVAVSVPKPIWLRSYQVRMARIVPYDAHGQLRSGLTIVPWRYEVYCDGAPERESGFLLCAAWAVCFVADRLHNVVSGERALCPEKPGSHRMHQTTIVRQDPGVLPPGD